MSFLKKFSEQASKVGLKAISSIFDNSDLVYNKVREYLENHPEYTIDLEKLTKSIFKYDPNLDHDTLLYAVIASHADGHKSDDILQGEAFAVETSEFNCDDDEFSVSQYSYGEKNVFVFTAEKNDLFLTAKGFSKKSYNTVMTMSKDIITRYPKETIMFVGHSSGAYLASLAAYATGGFAVTFNALGLTQLTKSEVYSELIFSCRIDAYILASNITTAIQSISGTLIPMSSKVLVKADGNIHIQLPKNILDLNSYHGVDGFLANGGIKVGDYKI